MIGMSQSDLKAQKGDTISVHYVGKFPGGKVFDTSIRSVADNNASYPKSLE